MKNKLMIRKAIIWVVSLLVIGAIVAGWYFTNPYSVSNKMLEQIQQEEGLK